MMKSFLSALAGLALLAASAPANAGLLYGIDDQADTLVTIDTLSFVTTTIGPLGTNISGGGLAYDPNTDTLFMTDGGASTNNLYTVDRNTGAASIVGSHGINGLLGLAFDSLNNVLYGSSPGSGLDESLVTLDTLTGASTIIAPMANNRIFGLAYDSSDDRLIGIDFLSGLHEINRTTGVRTLLASSSFIGDLAYDPDLDLFWGSQVSSISNTLVSFDPNNGFAQTNGPNLPFANIAGMAYVGTAITPVPEPSTLAALGVGLLAIGAFARRRRAG